MIIEKCGTVSFKSGEAFYRANKVTFEYDDGDICEATVTGKETFQVTIDRDENGDFQSTCSCPALASFSKDCQHIAAVLLAISEHQRKGTIVENPVTDLTNGLLNLFQKPSRRSSGHQLHFENRKVVDVTFTIKPVQISDGFMLGIQMKVNHIEVKNMSAFLEKVNEGLPSKLSSTFTFDLDRYCFSKDIDEVIQQLIEVARDEKFDVSPDRCMLFIPPSVWNKLMPLLEKSSHVKLAYGGHTFERLHVLNEALPLQFDFVETEGKAYQLKVTGLDHILVLSSYQAVLFNGKLRLLDNHDCSRLNEFKRMLVASSTNNIPIPREQLNFFLEKVVPGLKQLGEVNIDEDLCNQIVKTPLVAKLFLDRIKNRLLAGLEFHYNPIVINPLEDKEPSLSTMFIRNKAKEEQILELMEDSQFAKTESGYFLHNEELEYEFLTYIVPKLQKFTQIYTTTAVRNRVVREKAQPKIRVKVKKERTNWLEFKFEMDGIADDQIRELLTALEEKRKYYRLRNGSLLSLETKEFTEINRFLHGLPDQSGNLANGLSLPIEQALVMLDSVDKEDVFSHEESFRQFLDTLRNPGSRTFDVPNSLTLVLRDYQIHGFQWMKTLASYGFGGILADDMGLGKTLQSITYILSELSNIRKNKLPVLIVCPSSVTYNWLSEILKFASNLQTVVIDGKKIDRIELQKDAMNQDVIITSYPILRSDFHWFEKQSFHTAFFDEAQAFKNPVTKTARAVKKINAEHRFALTGTPVENSLEDLWSIFHVVFPALFQGLQEYSHLPRKTIARRIRPFMLRRMKEDVLAELPEKKELMESIDLLPEQKQLYAAYLAKLRQDTLKHLDKDTFRKNKIRILAGLTRLRQICCHPSLFVDDYQGSSAKFEQLIHMVEEAKRSGRRVLIFSQFTKMLDLIGRELANKGSLFFYLNGQTPAEERVETCHRFNEGERDVFLISLKAGGTGLNLTGADTVILYDSWWNPAVEEQAADRAYRIGQKNDVQVIKLVARGTIEEKMNELQEKKRHLIEEVIDSDEKASSTLTEDDIREVLMLKKE